MLQFAVVCCSMLQHVCIQPLLYPSLSARTCICVRAWLVFFFGHTHLRSLLLQNYPNSLSFSPSLSFSLLLSPSLFLSLLLSLSNSPSRSLSLIVCSHVCVHAFLFFDTTRYDMKSFLQKRLHHVARFIIKINGSWFELHILIKELVLPQVDAAHVLQYHSTCCTYAPTCGLGVAYGHMTDSYVIWLIGTWLIHMRYDSLGHDWFICEVKLERTRAFLIVFDTTPYGFRLTHWDMTVVEWERTRVFLIVFDTRPYGF